LTKLYRHILAEKAEEAYKKVDVARKVRDSIAEVARVTRNGVSPSPIPPLTSPLAVSSALPTVDGCSFLFPSPDFVSLNG
jgi:hypothetical protein